MPDFRFDKDTHTYWLGVARLPSVTQILDAVGLISPYGKRQDAAVRGTLVHLASQYIFENRLNREQLDDQLKGYAKSLDLWIQGSGFQARHCEVSGYHKELLYAGSWDVDGMLPPHGEWLIDLKSGVPSAWHKYQTAAYKGILGRPVHRGALYLQKSGKPAKFRLHDDPQDWPKFVSFLKEL